MDNSWRKELWSRSSLQDGHHNESADISVLLAVKEMHVVYWSALISGRWKIALFCRNSCIHVSQGGSALFYPPSYYFLFSTTVTMLHPPPAVSSLPFVIIAVKDTTTLAAPTVLKIANTRSKQLVRLVLIRSARTVSSVEGAFSFARATQTRFCSSFQLWECTVN